MITVRKTLSNRSKVWSTAVLLLMDETFIGNCGNRGIFDCNSVIETEVICVEFNLDP